MPPPSGSPSNLIRPAARLRRAAPALLCLALIVPAMPGVASAAGIAPSPATSIPAAAVLTVTLAQASTSYDATTNTAKVRVTATPSAATAPWNYAFMVRGTVVTSGSTSSASIAVTLSNNCSIASQSVTVTIIDAAGGTGGAAGTLDRSLCPPPPNVSHAGDLIMHGPTLTEASFVDRLRAVGSPALPEARQIYRTLVASGVNAAFALGTFQAESGSGTRGYAVKTRNWGNILYHAWEADFGAVPYAPGNGYTYAKYPTWLASVKAFVQLLTWYQDAGYTTVSSASAHWLGTSEGSARHLAYLKNITAVMKILPTDAVPVVTSLAVPAKSRAAVSLHWTATDDKRVTGYQVRFRHGTGAWSVPAARGTPHSTVILTSGTWTVGVRATDADANWSPWRNSTVVVDAVAPAMKSLSAPSVVRTPSGTFVAHYTASDAFGVTRYQYRVRRTTGTAWSTHSTTTATSHTFSLPAGSWLVQVRAGDAVGNWSDWRQVRVEVPTDDRSFSFSSGTVRSKSPLDYRGTVTTTSRAGARLSTSFTGTRLVIVGRSGPTYGRFRVTVDGVSYLVDSGRNGGARATITRHAVVLFSISLGSGHHVVTITNLATAHRPTIAIDGIAFVR